MTVLLNKNRKNHLTKHAKCSRIIICGRMYFRLQNNHSIYHQEEVPNEIHR